MNVLLRTAAAMAAALAALLTSAYAAACAAVCVAIDAATDAAVRAAASAGVFAVFLAASFSAPALADAPPEQLLHDEIDGQEYQTAVTAATHPDGSWTTVWVDYRSGYPALFSRIFEANGSARGDGNRLTDGRSLFQLDLNAAQVGEPSIVSLGDGRSLLVWDDERDDRDRIRAALLDTEGRVTATRTVSSDSRPDSRSRPQVAISGDRALVVWREGEASFSRVWGQLIALDLDLILPGNFRIDPEQDVRQADPRVIPSQDGWIVAWVEGDAEARVRLQRLDSIGTAQGDPAGVEEQPGWSQGQPAVLAVDDGAFVVWTSSNEGQVDLRAVTLDENLQPLSPAFAVISLGATVTPSDPAAGRLDATTLLVLWTGGPASHSRFYERRVELPGSPEGDFAIVDDPENPPGDVLIPHSLGTAGGGDLPLRLSWSDDRDGWQSVFQVEVGEDGSPQADPERIEPVEGSASQVLPSVDLFADGRAFAVWEDFRSGALSIYGRYLDDQGRPAGAAAFRISEGTGGSVSAPSENLRDLLRNRPSVGALADGRAVVAWTAILPGGRPSVALQNFEASGEPLGNNSGLPEVPEARQSDPRILPLPNGQYMIVWRDTSFETAGDIVGQIFDSDGTPAAGEDTIQIVPARYRGASQYGPAVASADAGEVLVAWLDDRALLGNYDVYAQRFNQSGQKIESNLRITPPEGTRPIVQANVTAGASADRYVVAWDEDPLGTGTIAGKLVVLPTLKNGAGDSGGRGGDASSSSGSGSATGGQAMADEYPFLIGNGQPGYKYPSVAMEPGGRFVVLYWDTSADSVRAMAQRFDEQARPIGEPYAVAAPGGAIASIPGAVAADDAQIQFVTFDSRRDRGWDVRARRVDWSFAGDVTAIQIAGASLLAREDGLALSWSVPIDRAGAAFRVWRQADPAGEPGPAPGDGAWLLEEAWLRPSSPGGADYFFLDAEARPGMRYAYWIEDEEGSFAGPWIGERPGGAAASLALRSASRNPFRDAVRLSWSAPAGRGLRLSIVDAGGRRVRQLLDRGGLAGAAGYAVWDGRDDRGHAVPAGTYWARLEADRGEERIVRITRIR